MASVGEWAVKIAEEVSPAEAELAPTWAEAFVKGGEDRRELFAQTNAQASAFLPGEFMPLVPIILKALALAAPSLLIILTSDVTGKFLEAVKNALAVGELFGKGRGWFSSPTGQKAEEASAVAGVYAMLNEVMKKFDEEVKAVGLAQAERDRVNLIVLRLILENPPDATQFLNRLAGKK